MDVLTGVQRWLATNGWPTAFHSSVSIPESFRAGLVRRQHPPDRLAVPGCPQPGGPITATEKLTLTVYDMLVHLAGRPIPGVMFTATPTSVPVATQLSADQNERVKMVSNVVMNVIGFDG